MDSSLAHNTATAMFVGEMGTELTPPQEFISSARTSIYGFPIKIFMNRIPDGSTKDGLPDEASGTKESIGIFNFNLDKGACDSLGLYTKDDLISSIKDDEELLNQFNSEYPYFDTLSFENSANSDISAGAFADSSYESIMNDFEYRFPDEDDVAKTNYYGTYTKSGSSLTLNITNKYEIEDGNIIPTEYISNNLITGTYEKYGDNYVSPSWTLEYISNNQYKISNYPAYIDKKATISELILTLNDDGTVIFTESDEQAFITPYVHLKKLIDWVQAAGDSTNEEGLRFYDDFEKHFNLSAVLDYYLLVLCNGMVDNLGKNMMLDSYGPCKIGKKFSVGANINNTITYTPEEIANYDNYVWYPHFYDLDTQLSLDNSGNVRYDTDIEVDQGTYNTSQSLLWTKFAHYFAKEIKSRYIELREKKDGNPGIFTIDNFMKFYYDNQISKIPEADYNANFYNKYLATEDRRAYLFMMHGSQYEMMYKWISERLYFLDTYFEYGDEYSKRCTVRVEYNEIDTLPVIYKIKTYVPSYVTVVFDNKDDGTVRKKVGRGQTVEFQKFITVKNDQETIIYNAGNIKEIGDVSMYSPSGVLMADAKKITKLIVGTEEHPNPNLLEFTLGDNVYLTEIVAENCIALNSSLLFNKCSNLEKLSLKGSTTTSVSLAPGAPLIELKLPKSIIDLSLDSMAILEDIEMEGTESLKKVEIKNCPKLTGYKDEFGNIVNGKFASNILNKYNPASSATNIHIDSLYGYMNNPAFLNSAASLADKYPDNFNITGQLTYTGSAIPDKYSLYGKCFPNLKINYPNVNNVSGMFSNYKNISLVWSRDEKIGEWDNEEIVTNYYWTDVREGEFPDEAYSDYDPIKKARKLDYYDEKDMKALADEIKERLAPLTKFTNMTSMFSGMRCFDYLHDDTFDNIICTNAATSNMFSECNSLKYFEVPKTMNILGSDMFKNCYRVLTYIPETVTDINSSAFYIENNSQGMHPVVLFQSDNRTPKSGIRDARYGIVPDENGRAMRHNWNTSNNRVTDYFVNKNNKGLIYKIQKYRNENERIFADNFNASNEHLIKEKFINIPSDDISSGSFVLSNNSFSNPMNISEFLHGSLEYFDTASIDTIALPSFSLSNMISYNNIPDTEIKYNVRIQQLEGSIARIFKPGLITSTDPTNTTKYIKNILLIPSDSGKKVSKYFLNSAMEYKYRPANPNENNKVFISNKIVEIEQNAFENCNAGTITICNDSDNEHKLQTIGTSAFQKAKLMYIDIPNTVTEIGDQAFMSCEDALTVKYSENMTYIPSGCFAYAGIGNGCTINGGFSENITHIEDNAFNTTNLSLFIDSKNSDNQKNPDPFSSYFAFSPTEENEDGYKIGKNLDYFKNLEYIGAYAFQNVQNITKLNIKPSVTYIGNNAFSFSEMPQLLKDTLITWEEPNLGSSVFEHLDIDDRAFAYRQLNWKNPNDDKIREKILYVPLVNTIGREAFSPYLSEEHESSQTKAHLDFLVTPISKEAAQIQYNSNFVSNHLETIYNFNDLVEQVDDTTEKYSNLLYILTNDTLNTKTEALIARLLKKGDLESTSVFVPNKITHQAKLYDVVEFLPKSLTYNSSALNSIRFHPESELRRFGKQFFNTSNISSIFVSSDINGITQSNLNIPETLTIIEDSIPFKSTTWLSSQSQENPDGYVYLNSYCLGTTNEIEGIINPNNSTKFIYENAFNGQSKATEIIFPENLIEIRKNAFASCSGIDVINFEQCKNTLSYIGDGSFRNCSKLSEISYTPNIKFIGDGAFGNISNLKKFEFQDGIKLDTNSEPISPIYKYVNGVEQNETINNLVISKSMGEFFLPGGSKEGYQTFTKLKNLRYLTLSTVHQTVKLKEFTEEDAEQLRIEWIDDYATNKKYIIDFSNNPYLTAKSETYSLLHQLYPQASTIKNILTSNEEFICPVGGVASYDPNTGMAISYGNGLAYETNIDLSNVNDIYDDADIIRILLGMSREKNVTIKASGQNFIRFNRSIFTPIKPTVSIIK